MNSTITLRDSRADGVAAAEQWMANGYLKLEHFTNPGADEWGEEGCNLGDAALKMFSYSRHLYEVRAKQAHWEQASGWGVGPCPSPKELSALAATKPDWEDDHLDAFLDGFETEAKRIAIARGWKVEGALR